jgi:hypothetical protein
MITDIFKSVAKELGIGFGVGREDYHNLKKPGGVYMWMLPYTYTNSLSNKVVLSTKYRIVMWVGEPHKQDKSPDQLDVISDRMHGLANTIMVKVINHELVDDIIGDASGEQDYHYLSMNATGTMLTFQLKLKDPILYCPPQPTYANP